MRGTDSDCAASPASTRTNNIKFRIAGTPLRHLSPYRNAYYIATLVRSQPGFSELGWRPPTCRYGDNLRSLRRQRHSQLSDCRQLGRLKSHEAIACGI